MRFQRTAGISRAESLLHLLRLRLCTLSLFAFGDASKRVLAPSYASCTESLVGLKPHTHQRCKCKKAKRDKVREMRVSRRSKELRLISRFLRRISRASRRREVLGSCKRVSRSRTQCKRVSRESVTFIRLLMHLISLLAREMRRKRDSLAPYLKKVSERNFFLSDFSKDETQASLT